MANNSYDRLWSDTWGDLQKLGPVHRHQREELLKLVRKLEIKTLCDVGCGSGENLAAFSSIDGLSLSGTDISDEALSLARRLVPSARLTLLDIQTTALDEKFDLVTSIQVVEHLDEDVSALRNIGQMARNWVVVTTMSGRMRPSELRIGHLRNYSANELRAKADAAHLDVVDLFGWGFPFYSPLYRSVVEFFPGGAPQGPMGTVSRWIARLLYQIYRLNIPRRGDVITMLAKPRES
jgi:SAM-dependent methyltransferase